MPRFAANLSMLYAELPFEQRFAAAAADGFPAVEYLSPYDWPAAALAQCLNDHGLQQVLFNGPPGGTDGGTIAHAWATGMRGIACLPGREAEFRAGMSLALEYAHALACPRIHVMAGVAPAGASRDAIQACYAGNLAWAAAQAAQAGCEVLIEPINTRDIPGFFLNRQEQAHAIVRELGAANLKVQMDLYHCQIVEGDVAMKLREYLPTGRVGHIQIAGVPERQEPDIGELNYPYLFDLIDELGYDGWVACEYRPRRGAQPGATTQGLGWLRQLSALSQER